MRLVILLMKVLDFKKLTYLGLILATSARDPSIHQRESLLYEMMPNNSDFAGVNATKM